MQSAHKFATRLLLFVIYKFATFLTYFVSEIGSCTSLSVLNLHNNGLTRLPEEIGHLQKLTSLGVIGNKLEYLPIPISNLPVLRALWLSQNQSHPLVNIEYQLFLETRLIIEQHTELEEVIIILCKKF